jgi:hypothetical protein
VASALEPSKVVSYEKFQDLYKNRERERQGRFVNKKKMKVEESDVKVRIYGLNVCVIYEFLSPYFSSSLYYMTCVVCTARGYIRDSLIECNDDARRWLRQ